MTTQSPENPEDLIPVFVADFMQKGGVGKTELTRSIAPALAEQGAQVLAVDLDPPGHLTNGLYTGHKELTDLYHLDTDQTLFRALIPEAFPTRGKGQKTITPKDLIVKLPYEKFDLLPAHDEMLNLQRWLQTVPNGYDRVKDFLYQITGYDYVIIDSPPDLGPISDGILNAMRDTDNIGTRQPSLSQPGDAGIVIPMLPDVESLNALDQLLDQVESLEGQFKIHISIFAIVMTQYLETKFSTNIMKRLRKIIPTMAPFEIRKRDVVRNAYEAGRSIYTYWPTGKDEQYQRAAVTEMRQWYMSLATHIKSQIERVKEEGVQKA